MSDIIVSSVWFAHIYRPGSNLAMNDVMKATREEGQQVLLKRVYARIDELIADLSSCEGSEPHE